MRQLCVFAALLLVAGCATDPAPSEQLRLTEQAMVQARAVGATAALPDMQLAEQQFARAQKNMLEQDYKRARMLAEQSELNARLAEAQVLTLKSQEQLALLQTRIKRLRVQLGELQ